MVRAPLAHRREKSPGPAQAQSLGPPSRNRLKASRSIDLISHSQRVATRHPSADNSSRFRESRARFPAIFLSQYCRLAFGTRDPREHECPCQKHPLMKTTFRFEGNTRSGQPGRDLTCSLYRYPSAWSIRRTINSGFVSLDLTACIVRRRVSDNSMIRPDESK